MGEGTGREARSEGRRARLLNRYFAPLLLVVVALVQVYRASSAEQSPWKGGGFGMFSTVTSPGARFVRARLVTPAGEIPIAVPGRLDAIERLTRTVPSERNLERLARSLLSLTWVSSDYHRSYLPFSVPGSSRAATGRSPIGPVGASATARGGSTGFEGFGSSPPRLRPTRRDEPVPLAEQIVPAVGVRVELWQYRFDRRSTSLRAELRRALSVTGNE